MLLLISSLWRYNMNGFKKLGEKIRFYREKKNISLEELAKLSGISEEKLRQIENAKLFMNSVHF